MAYAVRYSATFDTIDGEHTYLVEVLEDGYGGAAEAAEVVSPGLSVEWSREEGPGGLSPSVATVGLRDASGAIEAAFRAATASTYLLRIKRDGALFWVGRCETDTAGRSLSSFAGSTELRALCGLRALEGEEPPAGSRDTIRAGLLSVLVGAEGGAEIASYAFAADWYPYDPVPIEGDPWGVVRADTGALVDPRSGAVYGSAARARALLGRFHATALQWGGRFVSFYTGFASSFGLTLTDSAGTETGTLSALLRTADGSSIVATGVRTALPAIRSAAAEYRHGLPSGEGLSNLSFEDHTAGDPDGWTSSGGGAGQSEAPGYDSARALSFTRQAVDYDTGDPADFAIRYREQSAGAVVASTAFLAEFWSRWDKLSGAIESGSAARLRPAFWSLLLVTDEGAAYAYDAAAGSWTAGAAIKNRIDNDPIWRRFRYDVPGVPVDGEITLRFWEGVDTVDLGGGVWEMERTYFDEVVLDVLPGGEAAADASLLTLTYDDAGASEAGGAAVYEFGDGPTGLHDRRLTVDRSGVEVGTGSWQVGEYGGGPGSGNSIDYLSAAERLRRRYLAIRTIRGAEVTLRASARWAPYEPLSIGGVSYGARRYRLDAYRRRISADLEELRAPGTLTITESVLTRIDLGVSAAGTLAALEGQAADLALQDCLTFTRLASAPGVITSLPVWALTSDSGGVDVGARLIAIPPGGGFHFFTVSAAAAVGDDTISVEPYQLNETLRAGACLRVSTVEITAALALNAEALSVFLTGGPDCTLAEALSGPVSTIDVDGLSWNVPASPPAGGQTVGTITRTSDGAELTFYLTSAARRPAAIGQTVTLNVDDGAGADPSITAAIGDAVRFNVYETSAEFQVLSDRITAEVNRRSEGERVGVLKAHAAATHDRLEFSTLDAKLLEDDKITVYLDSDTAFETPLVRTVFADVAAGSNRTVILKTDVVIPGGDAISAGALAYAGASEVVQGRIAVLGGKTVIAQKANGELAEIALEADVETGSNITIQADQITVTGETTFLSALRDTEAIVEASSGAALPAVGVSKKGDQYRLEEDAGDGVDVLYVFDGTAWVRAFTNIDGGDLVTGSVIADKLSVTELSAIAAALGSVTAGSGSEVTIDDDGITITNGSGSANEVAWGTGANRFYIRRDGSGLVIMYNQNTAGTDIRDGGDISLKPDYVGGAGKVSIVGDLEVSGSLNGPGGAGHNQTLKAGALLSISSGSVTIAEAFHRVENETPSAADDLDTISGLIEGIPAIIAYSSTNSADLVIKHLAAGGNIRCSTGADITLSQTPHAVELLLIDSTVFVRPRTT